MHRTKRKAPRQTSQGVEKNSKRIKNNPNKESSNVALNFSINVANHLIQKSLSDSDGNNVVLSPISMDVILTILAAGATGKVLKQLLRVAECNNMDEVNAVAKALIEVFEQAEGEYAPVTAFANGLWVDYKYPLKKEFMKVLKGFHKIKLENVDCQGKIDEVLKKVDSWAKKQTSGLIKQLLTKDDVADRPVMILVNALFFKGTWVTTFNATDTENDDFYLLNGSKISVPFMRKKYYKYFYGELDGCQILRMQYKKGKKSLKSENERSFSMYIFLPSDKNGLPALVENINMDKNLFEEQIKLEYKKIDTLAIPKFEFDYNVSIKDTMEQLGLTLPFDKSCKELSEIAHCEFEGQSVYVSEILQKCHVKVDEGGTEAAVVTLANLPRTCAPPPRKRPPPIKFVADHPFMFIIREDCSGAILFVGTVMNPLSS